MQWEKLHTQKTKAKIEYKPLIISNKLGEKERTLKIVVIKLNLRIGSQLLHKESGKANCISTWKRHYQIGIIDRFQTLQV